MQSILPSKARLADTCNVNGDSNGELRKSVAAMFPAWCHSVGKGEE